MDKDLLRSLEEGTLKCSRCGLIIPFGFKKGGDYAYTVPSFTLVDGSPVCYSCYHPQEFSSIMEKRKGQKKKEQKGRKQS